MKICFEPIGIVRSDVEKPPRHWSVSDVKGELYIDPKYSKGLKDIKAGQLIVVLFHLHKSPAFEERYLVQKPPHLEDMLGVFSTCSPRRPNPIGLSVLKVLNIKDNVITVKGIDMFDGTPILDIKPYIKAENSHNPG